MSDSLHSKPDWYRATLPVIGDAVITTDIEGRVTFINPVAESLTGWTLDEATGLPLQNTKPGQNLGTHAIDGDSRQFDTIKSSETQFVGVPECPPVMKGRKGWKVLELRQISLRRSIG